MVISFVKNYKATIFGETKTCHQPRKSRKLKRADFPLFQNIGRRLCYVHEYLALKKIVANCSEDLRASVKKQSQRAFSINSSLTI